MDPWFNEAENMEEIAEILMKQNAALVKICRDHEERAAKRIQPRMTRDHAVRLQRLVLRALVVKKSKEEQKQKLKRFRRWKRMVSSRRPNRNVKASSTQTSLVTHVGSSVRVLKRRVPVRRVQEEPVQQASTVRVEQVNCQDPIVANLNLQSQDVNAMREHCKKLTRRIGVLNNTLSSYRQGVSVNKVSSCSIRENERKNTAELKKELKVLKSSLENRERINDKLKEKHKEAFIKIKSQKRSLDNLAESKAALAVQYETALKDLKAKDSQIHDLKIAVARKNNENRSLKESIATKGDEKSPPPPVLKKKTKIATPRKIMAPPPPVAVKSTPQQRKAPVRPPPIKEVEKTAVKVIPPAPTITRTPVEEMERETLCTITEESSETSEVLELQEVYNLYSRIAICSKVLLFVAKLRRKVKHEAQSEAKSRVNARRGTAPALFVRDVTQKSIQESPSTESALKSDATLDMLVAALKKVALLGPISQEGRQRAAQVMVSVRAEINETIVEQGCSGEHLYMIEKGTLDVLIDNKKVAQLSSGNFFGELALVFTAPRNATVVSKTKTQLWALDRRTYRNMLAQSTQQEHDEIRTALQSVPLLKSLSPGEIMKLGPAVKVKSYKTGQIIISKGDHGNEFFMIKTGSCLVVDRDFGEDVVLKPGAYFGERGLLTDEPRSATIVAQSNVTCLTLERKTFIELLGPLSDIMRKSDLIHTLESVALFEGLSHTDLEKVAQDIVEREYNEKDVIVRQGEDGHECFIVTSGTVQVTRGNLNDPSELNIIAELSQGECFGEGALMGSSLRSANVHALSKCTCLAIHKDSMQIFEEGLQMRIYRSIVHRAMNFIPEFKSRSTHALKEAMQHFELLTFSAGDIIAQKGQPALSLYIICSGEANLSDGSVLKPGNYVGTEMFQKDGVYPSTAEASMDISTFRLSQQYFFSHLTGEDSTRRDGEDEGDILDVDGLTELPLPGKDISFDQLNIMKVIGRGSFGCVKLATDKNTGAVYALKMIDKRGVEKKEIQDKAMLERQILASTSHPMLVTLHQTFKDTNSVYFLMELMQGGDLLGAMERSTFGLLMESEAKFYAANVILALEYLHSFHIAYRDLKPENITLGKDGYARLVDFGFAKRIPGGTRTFTLCGTPEYLAPEIVMGTGHSATVDLWSLGILLYDMLLGSTPFADHKHNNHMTVWKKVLKGKFKFPKICPVDAAAQDLIKKLLNLDACKRLGALQGGFHDIKAHEWFKDVDFEDILAKKTAAPWIPELESDHDTQYFEVSDVVEESGRKDYVPHEGSDWFKDF